MSIAMMMAMAMMPMMAEAGRALGTVALVAMAMKQ